MPLVPRQGGAEQAPALTCRHKPAVGVTEGTPKGLARPRSDSGPKGARGPLRRAVGPILAERACADRTHVIVECVRQTPDADREWKREWKRRGDG